MRGFLFISLFGLVYCDSEPQREAVLYQTADGNLDDCLDKQELDHIFFAFNADGDKEVTRQEFDKAWVSQYHLGNANEANLLFLKADTNDDGHITLQDMPGIFLYFDMNGDGCVNENEFLTQWGELKLAPVDVNIVDAGTQSSTAPPTKHR